MTPAEEQTLVAVYELAGAATASAVAARLEVSIWAVRARLKGLVADGWVTLRRPLRWSGRGKPQKTIVPTWPATIDGAGESRYRLVLLAPRRES